MFIGFLVCFLHQLLLKGFPIHLNCSNFEDFPPCYQTFRHMAGIHHVETWRIGDSDPPLNLEEATKKNWMWKFQPLGNDQLTMFFFLMGNIRIVIIFSMENPSPGTWTNQDDSSSHGHFRVLLQTLLDPTFNSTKRHLQQQSWGIFGTKQTTQLSMFRLKFWWIFWLWKICASKKDTFARIYLWRINNRLSRQKSLLVGAFLPPIWKNMPSQIGSNFPRIGINNETNTWNHHPNCVLFQCVFKKKVPSQCRYKSNVP